MALKIPFKEWDQISIESYKVILEEVRLMFEAGIAETVSVTDKTSKFLIGFLTFLFATCALIFIKYPIINAAWLTFFASAINSIYGVWIIRTRNGFSSGLKLDNITTKDIDNPKFTLEEKGKIIYLNTIKAYSIKIEGIIEDNSVRSKNYNLFIYSTT